MKVTITPETEAEKQKAKPTTVLGLRSVVVMGVAYEADVLRQPYSYSYGDLLDVLREFAPTAFEMECEILRARNATPGDNG